MGTLNPDLISKDVDAVLRRFSGNRQVSGTVALNFLASVFRLGPGLDRDGERVLTAVTSGTPRPATLRTLARVVAGHLFMTHRVSLLIRWHGIRLWLSRLPVRPRPVHTEEAVR